MSPFDFDAVTREYCTGDELERIKSVHVGLAGAGGLGSNCAVFLTRAGFRRFTVVDFDTVETGNLNRQAYTYPHIGKPKVECLAEILRGINPDVMVSPVIARLDRDNTAGLFSSCDVMVEALDTPEGKAMVVEELAGTGKLVVCASGIGGVGRGDAITTRRVGASLYIVGDRVSDTNKGHPPLAPRVALAAAKQADVVLAWALDRRITVD